MTEFPKEADTRSTVSAQCCTGEERGFLSLRNFGFPYNNLPQDIETTVPELKCSSWDNSEKEKGWAYSSFSFLFLFFLFIFGAF